MNLCQFENRARQAGVGLLLEDSTILDLPAPRGGLFEFLEMDDLPDRLAELAKRQLTKCALADVRLLAPVARQEVWAAGVTYLRSKKARMEESDFSASAYDKVYDAARPELFFKAHADKVVGPGDAVGIRADSKWNVPEPELALVINSRGRLAGVTIGNDMSSRDIEGENLLYLPQAKIYDRSCAIGPCIAVGVSESEARAWKVKLAIERAGETIFAGETSVGQIKRTFDELIKYLFRSQKFPHGAILLTGTGVVPPDDFTLQPGDEVSITISGIGTLKNSVAVV